jgi:hypothetical protein
MNSLLLVIFFFNITKKRRRKNTLNSEPQRTIRVSHVRRTPGATTTRGSMQTANRKQNSSKVKGKSQSRKQALSGK